MSLRHRIRFAASRQKPPIYPSSTILAGEPRGARLRGARLRLERLLRNYFSTDRGLLITLTIVSLCTRFYKLSRPPNVVFDELHFARFTENLLERKFVFDIHPWLGKLTVAAFAKLFGYTPMHMDFEVTEAYKHPGYYYARLPAAIFGTACVPLVYGIARELGVSMESAFATACLPLFDMLLLIESRLILIDAQLICYLNLALLLALKCFRATEQRRILPKYIYLIATAAACAAAMGVKWTAGATPFLIAVTCAFGTWHLRRPLPLHDCLIAAIIGVSLYILPWYIFTRVATKSTPGAERMSLRFRSTLTGNTSIPFNATHDVSFGEKVLDLHKRQFIANKKIKTRHKYESKWYEWPLNLRGIFYFAQQEPDYTTDNPYIRGIYLIQNPAAALWVLLAVTTTTAAIPLYLRYRFDVGVEQRRLFSMISFLLSGYFLNLLPYIFVQRCYFLYHYLPALTYGQLTFGIVLDGLPTRVRRIVGVCALATVLAAFVYWAPWVYAFRIHIEAFKNRRWMSRWD